MLSSNHSFIDSLIHFIHLLQYIDIDRHPFISNSIASLHFNSIQQTEQIWCLIVWSWLKTNHRIYEENQPINQSKWYGMAWYDQMIKINQNQNQNHQNQNRNKEIELRLNSWTRIRRKSKARPGKAGCKEINNQPLTIEPFGSQTYPRR